jgi:hypothetical protein
MSAKPAELDLGRRGEETGADKVELLLRVRQVRMAYV